MRPLFQGLLPTHPWRSVLLRETPRRASAEEAPSVSAAAWAPLIQRAPVVTPMPLREDLGGKIRMTAISDPADMRAVITVGRLYESLQTVVTDIVNGHHRYGEHKLTPQACVDWLTVIADATVEDPRLLAENTPDHPERAQQLRANWAEYARRVHVDFPHSLRGAGRYSYTSTELAPFLKGAAWDPDRYER